MDPSWTQLKVISYPSTTLESSISDQAHYTSIFTLFLAKDFYHSKNQIVSDFIVTDDQNNCCIYIPRFEKIYAVCYFHNIFGGHNPYNTKYHSTDMQSTIRLLSGSLRNWYLRKMTCHEFFSCLVLSHHLFPMLSIYTSPLPLTISRTDCYTSWRDEKAPPLKMRFCFTLT